MGVLSTAKTPPDGAHATSVEMLGERVVFTLEEAVRHIDPVPDGPPAVPPGPALGAAQKRTDVI